MQDIMVDEIDEIPQGHKDSLLMGGGKVGALMRAIDWGPTSLGPVDNWPQSLRTAVSICLDSRFPLLIWWGPDMIKLYNDAYAPILGDKHPSALGRRGKEVWPEIWDVIGPMLEGVLQRGEATWSDDQLLLLRRNGFEEECYFTFSYSPIRDETGGVGGIFTAVNETTQRVYQEQRLRLLRDLPSHTSGAKSAEDACERAAEVFAQSSQDIGFSLLYLLEGDGKRAKLVAVSGATLDAELRPVTVYLGETEDSEHASDKWSLAKAAQSRQVLQIENLEARFAPRRVYSAQGSENINSSPDVKPDMALVLPLDAPGQNQLAGFLVVGTNARRPLDSDYRDFLTLAAGGVATAVAEARAAQATRERMQALAELDRAKTAFFSNVSHEFRTPLTLMLGPIEDTLADKDSLSKEQQERTEILHRNSLRLLKLVNGLLDFSRIEAGRAQAIYAPTDLAAVTAGLASSFRSMIEKAGLHFIVDCPPLSEQVYVDRDMWERIVLNLLSNAFKYTFSGSITVSLKQQSDRVELSVKDTGTGIPEHELPHIFERFHRVQSSKGRTYEGTGIGLSLVQELVKLHGGSISVESKSGAGSEFVVTIPFGNAPLPKEHIESNASTLPIGPITGSYAYVEEARSWLPQRGGGQNNVTANRHDREDSEQGKRTATILLADDNADMRTYLSRLLEERYAVEAVADGELALAAVKENKPDLVLADVMMPQMDGFKLLRALKDNPETRDIPVIMLSARAGEESRIEGVRAGADDYLVKPFSARELIARVGSHLETARVRKEAARAADAERQRLYSLFMQAPAAIAVFRGPEHILELANPLYVQASGRIDLLDHVGRPLKEVFSDPGDERYLDLLNNVYATGETFVGVEMHTRPGRLATIDGEMADDPIFNVTFQPIKDAQGQVEGILAYGVDVTEQVLARRRVEESEGNLASTMERISDAFFSVDSSWRITYVNSQTEALLGKSRRELIGENLWQEFPAFNEAGFYSRYQHAMEVQQPVAFEDYSASSKRWYRIHTYPSSGGLSVYYSDITNEKRGQNIVALQARLLEQSRDAIFAWRLGGPIIYWNKGAERLYGYSAEQAIGTVSHTLLQTQHPNGNSFVERVVEETGEWEGELVHTSRGGEKMVVESRHQIVEGPDGHRVVLEINRDITDRKKAEEREALLSRLSEVIRIVDDPNELTWIAAKEVGEHLGIKRCFFAEIDLETDTGNIRRDYCNGVPSVAGPYRLSSYSSVTQKEIEAGHTVVNCDSMLDERTASLYETTYKRAGERAYVAVPLIRDKRWVGTFWVSDDMPRQWTNDEVSLLEVVAERIWVALEKLRSEQALRHGSAQFATLLNEAPIGVYLVDADLHLQQVNPTALPFFGDIPDLIGRDFDEVMHMLWTPDYADEVVRVFRHTLETGEPYAISELSGERFDPGVKEYYQWQIDRIPLPDGRYGVVCYFRDISEEVLAREAIASSEERYRGIVNQSVAGIAETDLTGRFITVNDQYCKITGYARAELMNIRRHEITHREDLPRSLDAFARLAAGGPGFEIEKRYVRKDGTTVWVHNSVSAVRDAGGEIRSFITIAIDITERIRAEETIRQSEEHLRAMFYTTTVGFATLTPDVCFTEINDAFCEITGYAREELLGLNSADITHADDIAPMQHKIEQLVSGVIPSFVSEKRYVRKDNTVIWVQDSVSLVHAADGTPFRLIAICQDITERRKLEQRKDDFIALASHELKTPITSLKMSAQLLKRKLSKGDVSADGGAGKSTLPTDDFVARQLSRMDEQLNKLAELVNDLLDVSRIEAGKLDYRMEEVDVDMFIRERVEELAPLFDKHTIVIDNLVSAKVICDRERIGQVLTNMIANAAKYSPNADRIVISSQIDDGRVHVSVQDFGIGVSPSDQERIFERFFQVRNLERGGGTYPGLGLGLYISSQIINSHRGRIEVQSEPGKGSTFRFTLPLARQTAFSLPLPIDGAS